MYHHHHRYVNNTNRHHAKDLIIFEEYKVMFSKTCTRVQGEYDLDTILYNINELYTMVFQLPLHRLNIKKFDPMFSYEIIDHCGSLEKF